jgi:hypothetical protein
MTRKNHRNTSVEHILHILIGAGIFVILALVAVAIDVLSDGLAILGASQFTIDILSVVSHIALVIDVLLFVIHTVVSSIALTRSFFNEDR